MATRETTSPPSAFVGRLGIAAGDLVRVLAPFLFAGWLLLVVVPGRPNLGPGVHGATVQVYILFAALFLAYTAYLVLARKLPDRTPLDWCALGLVLAYGAATLASFDPRVSLETSLQVGACVVAFYVFHERGFLSTDALIRSLVLLGGLSALLSLFQIAEAYAEWAAALDSIRGLRTSDLLPPPLLRSRGVIDHPNHLAMLLNLALPFAMLLVVRPRFGLDRVFGATVVVLVCAAMLFTQSRGAWLGLMVAQPLFWSLVYLQFGHKLTIAGIRDWAIQRRRLLIPVAVTALGAATVAVLYIVAVQPPWLFRATLGPRFETLSAGFQMFLDHPLTGAGPATFGLLNEPYGIERPEGLTIVHNAYVQVLVDVGVAGAIAVLAGGGVLAVSMYRAWKAASPEARLVLAASTGAIIAALVHGLFDSPPAWNTVLLPFALVLALAMRAVPLPAAIPGLQRRSAARLVALGVMPLVLAGWLMFEGGHSQYDQSLRASEAGRLQAAATHAVAAAERDPDFAAYQLHAGVSLVQLYLDDAGSHPTALDEGIAYLTRAASLDPHSSLAYANLALALQLDGNQSGAAEAAQRALTESPTDSTIAGVAGTVLERAGSTFEAIRAYATAVRLEPALSQTPFWSTSPEREALRPLVLQAAGLDACTTGRYAALYGVYPDDLPGLTDACRTLVEGSRSASSMSSLALMLHAQGNIVEASDFAQRAIDANSRSPDALVSSAVVLGDGDLTRVRTDLYRATQFVSSDGAALLAFTYQSPATAAPEVFTLAALPQSAGVMPVRAQAQLNRVAPTGAQSPEDTQQVYRRGRMYYTHTALREAPARLLIPGEWSNLVTPAVLLALELQPDR